MQQTIRIIEAQEERTDHFRSFAIAESPNDAVRAAVVFDLLHPVAHTRSVVEIQAFGDDTVKRRSSLREPFFGLREPERSGGQAVRFHLC